jgi:RNA polymerase sigma factor (sigma-70 family)
MTGRPVPEPAPGLLERARRGDDAAFAELYRTYAGRVHTVAARMLRQREAAEDVLQEVFLELTRALGGFRGDAPFWAWLRRLTVSKVLMRLRAERSRPTLVSDDYAPDPPGEDDADRAFVARDLEGALAELPPLTRAVVWLYDVEGWTHQEIAEAMGKTTSFSKSQLARAHQRLRRLLEVYDHVLE